jgi:hypothetical protein
VDILAGVEDAGVETDGFLPVGGEENVGFPVRTGNSKNKGAMTGE